MTSIVKSTFVLILTMAATNLYAQTKNQSDLFNTIQTKDSLLFEVGFNQCNLDQIKTLVVDDVEFYHDIDGITKSREKFLASIKSNLCTTGKNVIHRTQDKNNLEVFPLYRKGLLYGAIQNGSHRFGVTKASYSHLWLKEDNEWKLARVLSYNHHQEPILSTKDRLHLTLDDMKQYEGAYEFSPEFILTIRIKDGALYGESQGQEVKISSYAPHKFMDAEQTHDLEFLLDQSGKVFGLHMKGSGMEMTAKKK